MYSRLGAVSSAYLGPNDATATDGRAGVQDGMLAAPSIAPPNEDTLRAGVRQLLDKLGVPVTEARLAQWAPYRLTTSMEGIEALMSAEYGSYWGRRAALESYAAYHAIPTEEALARWAIAIDTGNATRSEVGEQARLGIGVASTLPAPAVTVSSVTGAPVGTGLAVTRTLNAPQEAVTAADADVAVTVSPFVKLLAIGGIAVLAVKHFKRPRSGRR